MPKLGNLRLFLVKPMKIFWVLGVIIVLISWQKVDCFEGLNVTEMVAYDEQKYGWVLDNKPLMVGLTLISSAAAKGAGILFISIFFIS